MSEIKVDQPFRCPRCGGGYFSRDIVKDPASPYGLRVLDTVQCNGQSSAGPGRCDWRGEWPPKTEGKHGT
jgi:hypothetical protein